jgi:hypothetical protein
MKKSLLLAVIALGLPFAALASTYDYVNTSGSLQSVVADTASQAFALATNIAEHSGVALDMGSFAATSDPTYEYVDLSGNIEIVRAIDAAQALSAATNIAPHSGVMEVSM